MNSIKFIFDLSCESPESFDSEGAVIVNDFSMKKENIKVDNLNSYQIRYNKNTINCANEFFYFNIYELFKRMTDEKVFKTLMFLYENEAENQCAIKIEKVVLLKCFKRYGIVKSEVNHGYLCLLILKNIQSSDKKDINEKIPTLIKGQTVSFGNGINFSMMINYEVVAVKDADDVAAEFRKIENGFYKTIPISVRFDRIYSYLYKPIKRLRTEHGESVLKLYFLVNLLLFRYYKKATGYPNCANSVETKQIIERICSFTKEFPEQGPFHKMQSQFDEFMLLLIHLFSTTETHIRNPNFYQEWKRYKFNECVNMLDNLARKNVIPQNDDYLQKTFRNINGEMQNILFLKYASPIEWSKIIVMTGEQWIPIFGQFYGENKVPEISLKNNKTIENFVWLYSEMQNGTEPFIILNGIRYSIGVVEREKHCIHKLELTKKQWICLNCKEIGEQKNKSFSCNCSNKQKQELSFCCLQCWSQEISNTNCETNGPTNSLLSLSKDISNYFRKSTDNQNVETNDSSITEIKSSSRIFKPQIESELIQQQPGPSSLMMVLSSVNQNNTNMNDKTITVIPEEVIGKIETDKLKDKEPKIEKEKKALCDELDQWKKDKATLEKKIRILEEQVEKSKRVNQNPQPSIQQMINNEDKNKIIEESEKPNIYTIVVVGATRAGKSTLIGGIANYLKWPKFYDAVKNYDKIETCIPIQFTVLKKGNSREICQSGFKDDESTKNENFNDNGQSVTQEPQIYEFQFNENTIRVIDTPGLEDSRGNEQDEKHLEFIQKMIENQDEIHGICFAVNQSKLTPEFELTIQKLLSLLPRLSLNNVFFFFTFSSPTYFAIGDVLNPLEKLKTKFQEIHDATFSLESNKTYCVDSESFRYLLCKQQHIEYCNRPESDFMFPWEESSKSVIEFLNYLKNVKPVSKQYFTANANLLKLLKAFEHKTISSEKQMAFEENFKKLKNVVAKHTLNISNLEIPTNLENVSQQEFHDAINNLIELFPNRRKIFSTFKGYVDYLIGIESNAKFGNSRNF